MRWHSASLCCVFYLRALGLSYYRVYADPMSRRAASCALAALMQLGVVELAAGEELGLLHLLLRFLNGAFDPISRQKKANQADTAFAGASTF